MMSVRSGDLLSTVQVLTLHMEVAELFIAERRSAVLNLIFLHIHLF